MYTTIKTATIRNHSVELEKAQFGSEIYFSVNVRPMQSHVSGNIKSYKRSSLKNAEQLFKKTVDSLSDAPLPVLYLTRNMKKHMRNRNLVESVDNWIAHCQAETENFIQVK